MHFAPCPARTVPRALPCLACLLSDCSSRRAPRVRQRWLPHGCLSHTRVRRGCCPTLAPIFRRSSISSSQCEALSAGARGERGPLRAGWGCRGRGRVAVWPCGGVAVDVAVGVAVAVAVLFWWRVPWLNSVGRA